MKLKNKEAKDDSGIAGLFAEFFSTIFGKEKNEIDIENTLKNIDAPTELVITEREVRRAMKIFPLNKGQGTDGFPPIVIRECMSTLAKPITIMFNKSIASGILPESLKTS